MLFRGIFFLLDDAKYSEVSLDTIKHKGNYLSRLRLVSWV